MDDRRFDNLVARVAATTTRRKGLAFFLGAAVSGLLSPTAEAKRKKSRCKHVTCRGECCKKGETCSFLGCFASQNLGFACFSQYTCSADTDCEAHNAMWYCSGGRCCTEEFPQ